MIYLSRLPILHLLCLLLEYILTVLHVFLQMSKLYVFGTPTDKTRIDIKHQNIYSMVIEISYIEPRLKGFELPFWQFQPWLFLHMLKFPD